MGERGMREKWEVGTGEEDEGIEEKAEWRGG